MIVTPETAKAIQWIRENNGKVMSLNDSTYLVNDGTLTFIASEAKLIEHVNWLKAMKGRD